MPTRRPACRSLPVLILGLCCVAGAAALRAQDPPIPPGGFQVRLLEYTAGTPRGPITWIDGVRTELDVYHPVHAAPPSGWPTVLVIHGGSGTRKNRAVRQTARHLTTRGYLCIAYDVRADGATVTLNPPGFAADDADQLRDMADAVRLVPGLLPAGVTMDQGRIAVTGDSQGGRHSLRAAAWSGDPLPAPVGPVTHFPAIRAVAPRITPLDVLADSAVDAHLANAHVVTNLYPKLVPTDPIRLAIEAEDWPTFRRLTGASPLRNYAPRLLTSTVPIQAGFAYEDAKHSLFPHLDAVRAGLTAGPVRVILSTSGHSTPQNHVEESFTIDQIGAWFDRWSKGLRNGVELQESRYQIAWRTDDPRRHTDPDSPWPHARFSAWPPRSATARVLHLRDGSRLTADAPRTAEPGFALRHRVTTPGYGIRKFCAQQRQLGRVLQDLALDELRFDGPPLREDLAIAGRIRLTLPACSATAAWQLTAALESVAPDGRTVQISSGTTGGDARPGASTLPVALDDVAFLVSAGHHLRLVIRNLAIHEPPGNRFLRWVPRFLDSDLTVPIAASDPPRLELPTVAPHPASLSPRLGARSASSPAGLVHPLLLEAGSHRAGQLFVVLMSGSGTNPGFTLPGAYVPLALDGWTSLAASGTPVRPFLDFAGLLDANGRAGPTLDFGRHPTLASLVGQRFAFAAGGVDPGGATIWASDAAELIILR